MIILAAGLFIFFGLHFYSAFRSRDPENDIKVKMGEGPYMGLYSLASVISLGLIVFGYWNTPAGNPIYLQFPWAREINAVTNFLAIALVISAYVPKNRLKNLVKHPMIVATAVWAGGHLLLTTDFKELLLFGCFLLFGIVDTFASFRRPLPALSEAKFSSDMIVLAAAVASYMAVFWFLHEYALGVSPR